MPNEIDQLVYFHRNFIDYVLRPKQIYLSQIIENITFLEITDIHLILLGN